MAVQTKNPVEKAKEVASSKPVKEIEKDAKPFQQFLTKFNNDGTMTFAGTLAYNLMLAMFPILIALISILGFTLGRLDPSAVAKIQSQIAGIFPGVAGAQIVKSVLNQLNKSATILLVLAILTAIFGGSRLFIVIEQFLDLIYHVRPRTLIRQNLVAIGMLLLFVVLIPLMVFASAAPAFVLSFTSVIPFLAQNKIAAAVITTIGGILSGIIVGFILFEAIYFVIPNQKISWRNSWRGALVAAILLEVYLFAFPFYTSHFLKGYAGVVGGGIILLLFFYYFAVILLLGGEINAFFSEKVQPLPNDVFTFVTTMAGSVNQDRPGAESKAHMNTRPTDHAVDTRFGKPRGGDQRTNQKDTRGNEQKTSKADTREQNHNANQKDTRENEQKTNPKNVQKQERVVANARLKQQVKEQKEMTKSPSTPITFIEIAVGAILTVVIEMFRLRQHGK